MREHLQKLMDEKLNPAIRSHGGYIQIADYANHIAYVNMTGGCQGCSSSADTLKHGVARMIQTVYPEVADVRDLTDHEAGENPYC